MKLPLKRPFQVAFSSARLGGRNTKNGKPITPFSIRDALFAKHNKHLVAQETPQCQARLNGLLCVRKRPNAPAFKQPSKVFNLIPKKGNIRNYFGCVLFGRQTEEQILCMGQQSKRKT
ncbi:hypothetical protein [Roseobacter sp.]|uniref:hypothetical protein n=1 Tax=Roseobacter sp. TaxID=1907202 RepID=UPI00385E2AC3